MCVMFGLRFFSGSVFDVVKQVAGWIVRKEHVYVCVTGAHGIVESNQNSQVLRAHKTATLVVPDGMPLVWMGRLLGFPKTQRIYGPDLFTAVCAEAQRKGWRIYLYGTTKETLTALTSRLNTLFPRLIICGAYAPPFRQLVPDEDDDISKTISEAKPHIVFVGLSTPKQEMWMYGHVKKVRANVFIGVGAAFDFVAGTKKQAPIWMRKAGLEWSFRLMHEPRRLWTRYLLVNTRFIALAFWQLAHPHTN